MAHRQSWAVVVDAAAAGDIGAPIAGVAGYVDQFSSRRRRAVRIPADRSVTLDHYVVTADGCVWIPESVVTNEEGTFTDLLVTEFGFGETVPAAIEEQLPRVRQELHVPRPPVPAAPAPVDYSIIIPRPDFAIAFFPSNSNRMSLQFAAGFESLLPSWMSQFRYYMAARATASLNSAERSFVWRLNAVQDDGRQIFLSWVDEVNGERATGLSSREVLRFDFL